MDDDQFKQLLNFLGYSWEGYRKVRRGVKKRIGRHMQQLGCRSIDAYLTMLAHRADIRHASELLMAVPISRFFRDRHLWQMLETRWLPELIKRYPLKITIWSAGCACGEEIYSLKILWLRLKSQYQSLPKLEILATDWHPKHIERAQIGIYNQSSLKEVAADVRADFFKISQDSKQFAIKEELKQGINWEIRNLLSETPESVFQAIFMRNNILTYCCPKDHTIALRRILKCLTPGGLLIMGCHEVLPFETGALVQTAECPYVYRKI